MKRIMLLTLSLLLFLTLVSCKKNDEEEIIGCPFHARISSIDEWVELRAIATKLESTPKEEGEPLSEKESKALGYIKYWDSCYDVRLASDAYVLDEIIVSRQSVRYRFVKPGYGYFLSTGADFEAANPEDLIPIYWDLERDENSFVLKCGENAADFSYTEHHDRRDYVINYGGRLLQISLPVSLGVETEEQLWDLVSIEEISPTPPGDTSDPFELFQIGDTYASVISQLGEPDCSVGIVGDCSIYDWILTEDTVLRIKFTTENDPQSRTIVQTARLDVPRHDIINFLQSGMLYETLSQQIGPADRDIGSGAIIYEWDLENGITLRTWFYQKSDGSLLLNAWELYATPN